MRTGGSLKGWGGGEGFEIHRTDGSLIQLFSIYNLPASNQALFK